MLRRKSFGLVPKVYILGQNCLHRRNFLKNIEKTLDKSKKVCYNLIVVGNDKEIFRGEVA